MSKLLASFLLAVACATAMADEPSVSYIFPAGGQRGTTVEFNVGGHYLHDVCPFEMLGPGVTAVSEIHRAPHTLWFEGPVIPQPGSQRKENYPKDQAGCVTISPDAELGFRRWRAWTDQGVTPSMKFVVGDLPEIIEQEIDGRPLPVLVRAPVTINGRIFPREDIDVWEVEARAGETFTCEVMAARLGSPLDSRLEVIGPDGSRVAENTDGLGVDSRLRFTASRAGRYQIRVHDINYDGLQHFVYRLSITNGPYVDHIYPLGGKRGDTVAIRAFGQLLPGTPIEVQLPNLRTRDYRHQFVDGQQRSNPVLIELSDLPEVLEQEPNADLTQANPIAAPRVANGRIQSAGDVDVWKFEAKKGEQLLFDIHASQLGSHLDSVLTIHDANDKQLAESDDANGGQTDSRLEFKVPQDGTYAIRVADRFSRGGEAAFGYRLFVTPNESEPDFALTVDTDALTLLRGGEAKLKVTARRLAGFQGAIELHVANLPAGVAVEGNKIAEKKPNCQLTFKADEKSKLQLARLKITGKATREDKELVRPVSVANPSRDDMLLDHLLLRVGIPTPFKVTGIFESKFVPLGSTHVRQYSLERNGFTGPVTISLSDRQVRHLQGVTGPTIVVPPGQSEFIFPIKLAPWSEIGRTSRTTVMAVGELQDEDGVTHKVSYTSHEQADQIIILADPSQLSVRAGKGSLIARPGTSVDLPVTVGRGRDIRGEVRVEVVTAKHIQGVVCESLVLKEHESDGTLKIAFAEGQVGPFNMPLIIRATAQVKGHPYTAETAIDVVEGR